MRLLVEAAGLAPGWPDERLAPGAEFERVAGGVTAGRPSLEDSWVTGFDRQFSLELGRRGWLGMTWPTDEGGHGRTAIERFGGTETPLAAGGPIAASWGGDRQIRPSLLAYGSPEHRRRVLPGSVS